MLKRITIQMMHDLLQAYKRSLLELGNYDDKTIAAETQLLETIYQLIKGEDAKDVQKIQD